MVSSFCWLAWHILTYYCNRLENHGKEGEEDDKKTETLIEKDAPKDQPGKQAEEFKDTELDSDQKPQIEQEETKVSQDQPEEE